MLFVSPAHLRVFQSESKLAARVAAKSLVVCCILRDVRATFEGVHACAHLLREGKGNQFRGRIVSS